MSTEEEDNPLAHYWLEGDSLAPPCQAEMDVVEAMLEMVSPYASKDSYVFDLGCGDGRICTAASKKFNCRSLGVEIEETEVKKFRKSVQDQCLEELVTVVHGDLRELDLQPATIICVYLLAEAMEDLLPAFYKALDNGCVMVFNTWAPKTLTPVAKRACGWSNNVNLIMFDKTSLPSDVVTAAVGEK